MPKDMKFVMEERGNGDMYRFSEIGYVSFDFLNNAG